MNEDDRALAEDVEANVFALLRTAARLSGAALEETAGFSRQSAFPDNAYFNSVWRAADDVDLDAQIAWFASRGVASFYWWTRGEPRRLGDRLRAGGFTCDLESSPGMGARLGSLSRPLGDVPCLDVLALPRRGPPASRPFCAYPSEDGEIDRDEGDDHPPLDDGNVEGVDPD